MYQLSNGTWAIKLDKIISGQPFTWSQNSHYSHFCFDISKYSLLQWGGFINAEFIVVKKDGSWVAPPASGFNISQYDLLVGSIYQAGNISFTFT